ncbi:hypothetical protein CN210_18570 [Sinorhizobium meliloti]|nr:hypothetical protein CDO24_27230 [Sinorhizobium meliloti]RMI05533.1 hypothetical protein DA101_023810 [Sinorhizobium meliloti]RVH03867.1 hypothetical protein CN210_18570 [Sinorhizobium meliloti]RVK26346.1 hypothetical protein CN156_21580 [Sinorhizobium meliloti]RVK56756.1 hypothetical protein CN155_14130 [Sinorhizobium meliloti]
MANAAHRVRRRSHRRQVLTENVAILDWVAGETPHLAPERSLGRSRNRQRARRSPNAGADRENSWKATICSATLSPLATRLGTKWFAGRAIRASSFRTG